MARKKKSTIKLARKKKSDVEMPRKKKNIVRSSRIGQSIATSSIINNSPPPWWPSTPLHRFPLEVRRMIYGFVFGERIVDVHQPKGPCRFHSRNYLGLRSKTRPNTRKALQDLHTFRTTPSPLAIAGTCQFIYQEAVQVWYENVTFFFYSHGCMMQFLDDIGRLNWLAIRHVGLNGGLGPDDEKTQHILWVMRSFVNMRTLTIEDVGNQMLVKGRFLSLDVDVTDVEEVMAYWQEDAEEWLAQRERLEMVLITTKFMHFEIEDNRLKPRWELDSRGIKLNRRTGEILIGGWTVKCDNTEDATKNLDVCTRGSHSCTFRLTPA
jgi:hypothetical protein